MAKKKTPADYHALAGERGFRWLGPEVPNTATKTLWECQHGHRWEARYNSVRRGSGCPVCAGNAPKTPADYHALARASGFRWMGPEASNCNAKTWWECGRGHQWQANYGHIQQGRGCPFCSHRVPKTAADYRALAKERGLRWLGPPVPNVGTNTGWECVEGHHWLASYNNIQQGHGCPVCYGNAPKTPADYHALARERGFRWVGPEVPNVHTKTGWECEKGHRWQAPYSALHGCPVCAGNAPKTPRDYHALARERGLRWLGPEAANTSTKTWWECKDGHQWEADYRRVQRGDGCPICYGNAPKSPEDYHSLAAQRGLRWVGPEVSNTAIKTCWECEHSHQWEATYHNILRESGCPFCAGLAPKTAEDYRALASERGFRWLGPEVPNVLTKTWWECEQGHRWEAVYSSIRAGTGCPICIDMVEGARVSQVQRELCQMLGGELNRPHGSYRIDVALSVDGIPIAVEYDSWYWHQDRQEQDAERDKALLESGWRVLHVRSNELLPTQEQLNAALARLVAGQDLLEIVLDDWGGALGDRSD